MDRRVGFRPKHRPTDLVALDLPAKSEQLVGGLVESTFISTNKLKSKDPTQ